MRFLAFFLASALPLAPVLGATQPSVKPSAQKSVRWVGLENGVKNAAASGKYVFVSIYTDWCGYCRKLNTVTLRAEPVLAELGKNFESVRLNAESEDPVIWKGKKMSSRQLAAGTWGVEGFPTLLFLSPKGEIIGSFSSYVEPDLMIKLLTYISSGARERKVSFDEYLGGKG